MQERMKPSNVAAFESIPPLLVAIMARSEERREEKGRPQRPGTEAGMPTPILATKLYIPRLRPNVVLRPRLIERLNEGLYRKLTLISAPAGFGKTTLVSEWLAGGARPAAWLSLEDQENDPARFLTTSWLRCRRLRPRLEKGS